MRVPLDLTSAVCRRRFLAWGMVGTAAALWPLRFSRAAEAPEDSWTSFRNGPQLLGVAHTQLPDRLELLWDAKVVDGVVSTPVIANGRVYVGGLGGDLLCFDLQNGKEIWKYRSIDSTEAGTFAPGFAAPIAVSEELVFGGDDSGVFHAVEKSTGQSRWKFTTDAEIIGGPTLHRDRVLFGSHDGKLYCLSQADGSKVWEFETQGPVNGTPAISGSQTFITGCDKPVMRIVDVEKGEQIDEAPLEKLLIASAAVLDEILYFGTDGGSVLAFDWKQKKTLWRYAVPNREQQIQSSPAIQGDILVIGSRDKHLHAIDRRTGQGLWTFPTRAKIDGCPVIVGDRVFFGSADRIVYGVSLQEGREVWKYSAGQSIVGSPAVAEGRLVIGTETSSGRVLCFGGR